MEYQEGSAWDAAFGFSFFLFSTSEITREFWSKLFDLLEIVPCFRETFRVASAMQVFASAKACFRDSLPRPPPATRPLRLRGGHLPSKWRGAGRVLNRQILDWQWPWPCHEKKGKNGAIYFPTKAFPLYVLKFGLGLLFLKDVVRDLYSGSLLKHFGIDV